MSHSQNPPSYTNSVQGGVYNNFYLDPSRREFRLLSVSSGSWTEPVKCTLHKSSLNIRPNYRALSYTWGDASDRQTITLNGQFFSVTSNLANALHRIRGIGGHKWYWWIDALCINQSDASEKSHQIQMMRQIYSSCQEVLIYLGEVPRDDSFTFINPKSPLSKEATRPVVWHLDNRDKPILDLYWNEFTRDEHGAFQHKSVESFDKVFHAFCIFRLFLGNWHVTDVPPFNTPEGWKDPYSIAMASALQSLADLPWWTRAWTAQEVIFAPKATMVYGPIIFPMDIWQDAFINFTNHRYSCCESSPMPHNVGNALVASTHDLDDIAIMKAAFETNDRSGWQRSIFRICTQFACRTSTDDHDKVYAFLGLVTDWLERAPIYPDYNISIPDLFTKVTLDLLLASQRLDALINNLEKSRHTNLPSWVLDLTNQNLENINDTRRGMITQYKTTLEPTATIRWLPPRILCVTGFELDTVAAVTDSVGACQKLCSELFLLAGLDRSPQRPYPRGRDYLGAYWRTLCSECICVRGKNEQLGNVTHDYHRVVPGHYDVFVDWAHSRNTSPFYSGPDGDQNGLTDIQKKTFTFVPGFQGRQFDYEPRHLVSIKDFWAAMRNGLRDRKGFITKGGLLGSGPRAMRPGDRVWLLNGGSVPFILRRKTEGWSGDAWEILGYAYVQGIMDGEAVKEGGRVREVYLV